MGSDLSSVEDLYKHKKRIRLDPGKWKYVVIKVSQNGQPVYFIRSKKWANFHEEIIGKFSSKISNKTVNGKKVKDSTMIECLGGGKIYFNPKKNFVEIYGKSMKYGRADHEMVKKMIIEDFGWNDDQVFVSYKN